MYLRSGNVLFLILIAVALFAALSYAVTQASRGGGKNIADEQASLETSKQQSIQANIDGALWRLKLINGCRDNEISYETPSGDNANPDAPEDNSCHVYHPDGGGVPYIDIGGGGGCDLTALAIGEACDGVIYAGESGGNRIYTTPADQGLYKWKNARSQTVGTDSNSDGVVNTNAMASAGLSSHPAAQACRALGEEWYLPSRFEISTVINGLKNIESAGIDTSGTWYWSSTQSSAVNYHTAFTSRDGSSSAQAKDTDRLVRCVRRD